MPPTSKTVSEHIFPGIPAPLSSEGIIGSENVFCDPPAPLRAAGFNPPGAAVKLPAAARSGIQTPELHRRAAVDDRAVLCRCLTAVHPGQRGHVR